MTTNELAKAVKAHAVANYNDSGWDWIVECWEDRAIEEELERSRIYTLDAAILAFTEAVMIWDERRRDVQAEIF